MKKKILQLIFMLIILLGVVIAIFHFVNKEEDKTFTDAEILEILSEKSGIDFQDSIIQEVKRIHIADYDSGIYVILQMDESRKTLIEERITQMRYRRLENDDTLFPETWKKHVDGVTDYACYEVNNGARKYAKSLNRTTCLFVPSTSDSVYTVYVYYAGD